MDMLGWGQLGETNTNATIEINGTTANNHIAKAFW